jgi:uncharacterized protein Veg
VNWTVFNVYSRKLVRVVWAWNPSSRLARYSCHFCPLKSVIIAGGKRQWIKKTKKQRSYCERRKKTTSSSGVIVTCKRTTHYCSYFILKMNLIECMQHRHTEKKSQNGMKREQQKNIKEEYSRIWGVVMDKSHHKIYFNSFKGISLNIISPT